VLAEINRIFIIQIFRFSKNQMLTLYINPSCQTSVLHFIFIQKTPAVKPTGFHQQNHMNCIFYTKVISD